MNEKLDATIIDFLLCNERLIKLFMVRAKTSRDASRHHSFYTPVISRHSTAHKEWVLKLASDLRAAGVDVVLDQWDLALGQDLSIFMKGNSGFAIEQLDQRLTSTKPKRVLAAWVTNVYLEIDEVVASIDTTKFIPIVRGKLVDQNISSFLAL